MADQPDLTIPRDLITGLVLAGGRGSRMGGVDKGLQTWRGAPLALHAILRLQPQVGAMMVNANRNIGAYEALGVPVWPDGLADYPGPLAGFLAGLEHCETPYLATVPCDSPRFPADLVARLAAGLRAEGADIALAATREAGQLQPQPVFSLIAAHLVEDLVRSLQAGERKIDRWMGRHRLATVVFDEADAFFNANTREELRQLDAGG